MGQKKKLSNKVKKVLFALFLSAVLLLTQAFSVSCWNEGVKLNINEIDNLWSPNVVEVMSVNPLSGKDYSHASGIVFDAVRDEEGRAVVHIVTSAHAVIVQRDGEACERAKIRFVGEEGFAHAAYLIGYSAYHDIAVLRLEEELPAQLIDGFINFSNPKKSGMTFDSFFASPVVDETQYSLGYDEDTDRIAVSEGKCSKNKTIKDTEYVFNAEKTKQVPVFETTANVKKGKSGGAVVNKYGQLVGIGTYNGDEGLYYAVNATLARKIFQLAINNQTGDLDLSQFDYKDGDDYYRTFLRKTEQDVYAFMNVLCLEKGGIHKIGFRGIITVNKTLSFHETGEAFSAIATNKEELKMIDNRGFSSYSELMEILYDYKVVSSGSDGQPVEIAIIYPDSGNTIKKTWEGAGLKVVKK